MKVNNNKHGDLRCICGHQKNEHYSGRKLTWNESTCFYLHSTGLFCKCPEFRLNNISYLEQKYLEQYR